MQNKIIFSRRTSNGRRRRFIPFILLVLAFWGHFFSSPLVTSLVAAPASAPLPQAATDIDLITNIDSDKSVVIGGETIIYTVTVENRGPATATNADWVAEITSASIITNTACIANTGAICPAAFTMPNSVPTSITGIIPSLAADSVITLTFETTVWSIAGDTKSISRVTANGQNDSEPATNEADINISVLAALRSYGITKSIDRYEDVAGNPVGSPTSGDYVIYEVVVANSGIDDVHNLSMNENIGVEAGTGEVITNTVGSGTRSDPARLSGLSQNFYAEGTTIESITCISATNGAICPADLAYNYEVLHTSSTYTDEGNPVISYLPGRTRAAAGDPAGNPESTVTFEVKVLIGEVACSSVGGNRTFVNRAQVYTSGNPETAGLVSPYGPGDSTDNIAEVRFDVATPTCLQFDIATQLEHNPVTQAGSGVDGNNPYGYTVTVVNNGGDTAIDLPFFFGLYAQIKAEVPDVWTSFWTIDNSIGCTPTGGAVCPTGYTITPQESTTNSAGTTTSSYHQLPDVNATIPSLPSGGSLVFTITGTAGDLNSCDAAPDFAAHAHSIPINWMYETLIDVPTTKFASYYRSTTYGYPSSDITVNTNYYGNNGYNLGTTWNTGIDCSGRLGVDYDVSVQLTGPFPDASSTTPIAAPLAPGQEVYYRALMANVDDGDDIVDFIDPAENNPVAGATAYLFVGDSINNTHPDWLDVSSLSPASGWRHGQFNYFHPLDTVPGTVGHEAVYPEQYVGTYGWAYNLPWAAVEESGYACLNTTGGAECPDPDDNINYFDDSGLVMADLVATAHIHTMDIARDWSEGDTTSLHLPVGSTMELLLPFRVPDATVNCVSGGDIFTLDAADGDGPVAVIVPEVPSTTAVEYVNRNTANDRSDLTFQVEIPACVSGIEIDKQIVVPAAADLLPSNGLVQYTIDLTYPATSTQALDVARFVDIPSFTCANNNMGKLCADIGVVNIVGCSVTSGAATCPPSIPIGQLLAQDGTLSPITPGTVDTRWGTPNATTVAGGAAFEPGSSIRVILEAQLSNEISPISEMINDAVFASDSDSSQFGAGLYTEDRALISPPSPDSMVLRKQVTPTDAQQGETVFYTIEAINNGVADGQGAIIGDTVPMNILVANPSGFTNLNCAPITTSPPLLDGGAIADCTNVTMTNSGTAGFQIEMTGSWPAYSGYRFTFQAIAPFSGTSVENTAILTPPPATNIARFGTLQDSTVTFRTPDKLSLGNLVWYDTNDNSMVDGTEAGVDGVTVELYAGTAVTGIPLSTTTTSGGGFYRFDELDSGDYIVHIPASQFAGGAPLAGYQSSTGSGADDTNDDNIDENGLDTLDNGGISSAVINLAFYAEPTAETGEGTLAVMSSDDNENLTVDFGFYQPSVLIGDRVWIEDDNDGLATTGVITPVIGSVITAVASDGTVYTDTTDAMGYYTITVPANEVYTVTVGTPAGTVVAVPASGLVATDNDPSADDDTSHDPAGTVVIVGTVDNLTIDFGFYPPITPTFDLALVKTTAATTVDVGDPVTFTLHVMNQGTADASNIEICDWIPAGFDFNAALSPAGWNTASPYPVYTIPALAAGMSTTVDIVLDVNMTAGTATDDLVNSAEIRAAVDDSTATAGVDEDSTLDAAPANPNNDAVIDRLNGSDVTIDEEVGDEDDHDIASVVLNALQSIALEKVLNTPDSVMPSTLISFTIRITNTGETVITTLPLTDVYNSAYLAFVNAIPATDDNLNDGSINWSDLTTTLGDLDPGDSIAVVVSFTTQLDTTALPGNATINRATVWDEVDEATVQIFSPTSVDFIMRAVSYENERVVLRWETADETDVVGFHIYRLVVGDGDSDDDSEPIKLTSEMLIAQKSGSSSGASYTYEDEHDQAGVDYRYFVGIIDIQGLEAQEPFGELTLQRTVDEWFIFLPITLK